jgi:hypothetical protein
MRIEGHGHRASPGATRIRQRPLDHRAMSEMHPIEDADREEHWPRNAGEMRNGAKRRQGEDGCPARCRTLRPIARILLSRSAAPSHSFGQMEPGSEVNELSLRPRVPATCGEEEERAKAEQGQGAGVGDGLEKITPLLAVRLFPGSPCRTRNHRRIRFMAISR